MHLIVLPLVVWECVDDEIIANAKAANDANIHVYTCSFLKLCCCLRFNEVTANTYMITRTGKQKRHSENVFICN